VLVELRPVERDATEHVRTTTGPSGHRVSHYRPLDEQEAGAPVSQPGRVAPSASLPGAGFAAAVQSLQTNRAAALTDVIDAFSGRAAGVGASLGQFPPDLAAQSRTALGGTATASARTTALAAPAAPLARATLQAALARMNEITPHLAAEEMATAQLIAASLPSEKRALLMAKLVAVPLADAVAIVKDILATHAAHGNPYR